MSHRLYNSADANDLDSSAEKRYQFVLRSFK